MVQSVLATIMLSAALNTNVALEEPEEDAVAVKVVVPHPLMPGERELASVKSGSATLIVSDTLNATLRANKRETAELAAVTAFVIINLLFVMLGVGGRMADDVVIGTAVMSLATVKTADMVRVAISAGCAYALLVTPVATVILHREFSGSFCEAAVKVIAAVDVPEFDRATLNVVVPHPVVVGDARLEREKSGSVITNSSFISNPALVVNVNVIGVAVEGVGLPTLSSLSVNTGTTMAVDSEMAIAPMSVPVARVIATVRMLRSATWGVALVVTPVAMETVHWFPSSTDPEVKVNKSVASTAPLECDATDMPAVSQPFRLGVDSD